MPDEIKKSPGLFAVLMQRFTGGDQMPPEIQEAITIAKKERPDLGDVSLYGPVSRMVSPNAQGYVSPGRTIYLNPAQMKGYQPQDIADTLLHEQTHVDQMRGRNKSAFGELVRQMMSSPSEHYGQRPEEMEAFQVEKERRFKMGRPQTPVPSFDKPGGYYIPQDINLPKEKK